MGSSPSAELYWGYNLGEMVDENWEPIGPSWLVHEEDFDGDDRDWREELATRLGWEEIPYPDHLAPTRPAYTSDPRESRRMSTEYEVAREAFYATTEYKAYSENRDRMGTLVKDCPAELSIWNSSEDFKYCVRIVASVQRADDWGSTELKPLEVEADWREQLHRFMQLLELPIPEGKEPGWHMCCAYG
jgi:hypothetical protein